MNAVVFVIALILRNVLSQQSSLHDANYVPESDVDYQEYQPFTKASKNSPLANRQVKTKSSIMAQSVTSTPVPILKQINRHNEDGSYTYGFENADGSFKIETKLASGEVVGKYGYVDDTGKLRVVEYGANKYGFQPAGDGITIPPPLTPSAIVISNETNVDEDDLGAPSASSSATIPLFFKTFFSKAATSSGAAKRQRKPSAKPVRTFSSDRKNRYSAPTTYFVGTRERPAFITAADINSLQYLMGAAGNEGDLSQLVAGQIKSTNWKVDDVVDAATSADTAVVAGHQSSSSEEFAQLKSDLQAFKNTRNAHGRTKPKAQFWLIAPAVIEEPTSTLQQTFKRSSNYEPESGSSILDELLKQYAVPNESPAINNFSFGTNDN